MSLELRAQCLGVSPEQAKGILMERNRIDAEAAFGLLKSHSQQTGQKLSEVAQAITQTHLLLPSERPAG